MHLRGGHRDRPGHLTRYIVSEDVGPMINPNVVEGQCRPGGTVQGIGGALLENLAYDDEGNPVLHLRGLPAAYGHRGARHRVRPRGDAGPGVGGYKGRRRGRRHRLHRRGHQRHQRRTGAVGCCVTTLPATPAHIVELIETAQKEA